MTAPQKSLKAAATGQAAPPQEDQSYTGFKNKMELSKAQFLPLLGNSTRNVDAFLTVVYNAVAAEPDLLLCDRRSLFLACMRAAQDGLLPDKREAVLNVYNTKVARNPDRWAKVVQYLPMVRGLVKKMKAIPGVRSVDAAAVYAGEPFKYQRGDEPRIEHEPRGDGKFEDIVAAYCVVTYTDGSKEREVMFRRDIDKARAASKTADSGPWVTWFDQMAIKSVIHRIYKRMPSDSALDQALRSDAEAAGWDVAPSAQPAIDNFAPTEGAPSLTDQSGQGMTFENANQVREAEQVQPVGKAEKTASKAKAKPEVGPTSEPEKINTADQQQDDDGAPSFDEIFQGIKNAKSREIGADLLDLARHLTEHQQAELAAALASRFPADK
jgi:recombination protein RecT